MSKTDTPTMEQMMKDVWKEIKRLEQIETEIKDVKKGFSEMKAELTEVKEDVADLKDDNVMLKKRIKQIEEKVIYGEDYSRKKNIILNGIEEYGEEKPEDCKTSAVRIMTDILGVEIIEEDIERAHRIQSQHSPKPIIIRFKDYKKKEKVMKKTKNLKDTVIGMSDDYSAETRYERKKLLSMMKEERKNGNFAEVRYKTLTVKDSTHEYTYRYDRENEKVIQTNKKQLSKTTILKRKERSPESNNHNFQETRKKKENEVKSVEENVKKLGKN